MPNAEPPEWLRPREVAEEYNIPEGTLGQWRYAGRGPKFYRFGKSIRYKRSEIEAWAEAQSSRRTA